jgi:hypothetical protein
MILWVFFFLGTFLKTMNILLLFWGQWDPLYTTSQGLGSTQTSHSYWCKTWILAPRVFTLAVKGWIEKIFSVCPKLLIN